MYDEVAIPAAALIAEGQAALGAGDWPIAKDRFSAYLEREPSAEAMFGLGIAQWWLADTDAALRSWEQAYAAFRKGPDPGQAVLPAFYLCLAYHMSLGNETASRGWLERAASLAAELDPSPLNGWVLLLRAYTANESGHPQSGEGWAREARDIAREAGDADLELCAISELGAALVELGRVEEGAALLDEAMAAALAGEGGDLDTVVLVSCRTISSCSRGGELKRASQWVRAADGFHRRYGSPHLYATCRTHYGGILCATGDWEQAEAELQSALEIGRSAEPALLAEALALLAQLRLAQGRLEEALRLLEGYETHPATAGAMAAIHLVKGEPAIAGSVLRRRLRELDDECLESAALQELLVEAELDGGATDKAIARARSLAKLGASMDCELVVGRAQRALGRTLSAVAEAEQSIEHLERALSAFGALEMPLEAGRTRLLIAKASASGDPEAAIAEARSALAAFESLGAARDADEAAALLRSLGVKAARSGPKGIGLLTKREVEVLALLGEGLSNPDIAERLFISRKTVEHHVARVLSKLELSGRGEATAYAIRNLDAEPNSTKK